MLALKQGSVPDVIANKLDHLLILTSGTEQYLITCTNKKYKFLLTTTLTISDLVIYGIAIPVSLFALYTFIFIFDNGIGWKIALTIIGLGWLVSAISGFINNLRK